MGHVGHCVSLLLLLKRKAPPAVECLLLETSGSHYVWCGYSWVHNIASTAGLSLYPDGRCSGFGGIIRMAGQGSTSNLGQEDGPCHVPTCAVICHIASARVTFLHECLACAMLCHHAHCVCVASAVSMTQSCCCLLLSAWLPHSLVQENGPGYAQLSSN